MCINNSIDRLINDCIDLYFSSVTIKYIESIFIFYIFYSIIASNSYGSNNQNNLPDFALFIYIFIVRFKIRYLKHINTLKPHVYMITSSS